MPTRVRVAEIVIAFSDSDQWPLVHDQYIYSSDSWYIAESGIFIPAKSAWVRNTRVDLHTPKMLIIQFHTTKIIMIQFHTSNLWSKCLTYNFHTFSKNNRKKLNRFCGFLRTVKQTGDKKKLILNLF